METKSTRAGRSNGEQAALGEGQHGANLLIGGVRAAAHRNNHVVAVVAAEQEDTDQRLVVLGGLRQRVHHAEPVEAGSGKSGSRGAARPLQKVSA